MKLGSLNAMGFCVVSRDLNRYLADQDRRDREEEFEERRLEEIQTDLDTWPHAQWSECVESDCPEDWERQKPIVAKQLLAAELRDPWRGCD
jgi:hypothetical protein